MKINFTGKCNPRIRPGEIPNEFFSACGENKVKEIQWDFTKYFLLLNQLRNKDMVLFFFIGLAHKNFDCASRCHFQKCIGFCDENWSR